MTQANKPDPGTGLETVRPTPNAPDTEPGYELDWMSNANLLARAAKSKDPVMHELASRYAAALEFLHKASINFTPLER